MQNVLCAIACGLSLLQPVHAQDGTNQFRFKDYLIAPIRVHLLSARDSPFIQTTLVEADITRILGKVNSVWAQAGFHFYLESLVSEEANQSEIHAQMATLGERSSLLDLRPNGSLASNTFHIYYIKQMPMNGIYFEEGIFVKDSASLREVDGGIDEPLPRVSSHELGHALGLPHRQCVTNLMASGTTGTWLNAEEIRITREAAHKFSWIQTAPDLMKKANSLFRAKKVNESMRIYSSLASIPVRDNQVDLAKRRMTRARPTVSAKEP